MRKFTVSGTVRDAGKTVLPGASVILKGGAGQGVSTDEKGQFTFTFSTKTSPAVLEVGFLGMETQQVIITGSAKGLNVTLKEGGTRIDDVVVGYGDITSFETGSERFFGALIGRYGNRIGGASFPLDGDTVYLTPNETLGGRPGHLHGGTKGFDRVMWRGEPLLEADRAGVRFSRLSPDGEEGYPGNLACTVTYWLSLIHI